MYANADRVKHEWIEAFRYALDQQAFVSTILGGYGGPAATPLVGPAWQQAPDVQPAPYDPEKAKQMLTDAGFDFDTEFIYLLRDDAVNQQRGILFAGFLTDIGVNVTLEPIATSALGERRLQNDWDFCATGTPGGGIVQPAEACFSRLSMAYAHYEGDWQDLCDQLYAAKTQEEYQELTHELQRTMWEKPPWITLYESMSVVSVNRRIAGFEPVGSSGNLLQLRPSGE